MSAGITQIPCLHQCFFPVIYMQGGKRHPVFILPLTGTEMAADAHVFPQSSECERPVYILFKLEKKSQM